MFLADNFLPSGVSNCRLSEYGCCPDQFTAAEGPDYLGCASDPIPPGLCIDTEFGCCPDGLTPAGGPFQRGCLTSSCKVSLFPAILIFLNRVENLNRIQHSIYSIYL